MKKYFALLMFTCLLFSCQKDDISPTQGQLTAARLKSDIGSKSISSATVHELNSIIGGGTSFKITDDGFIVLSTVGAPQTFNLENLVSYQISGTTVLSLDLYF